MQRFNKKFLSVLTALVLAVGSISIAFIASANDLVAINEANFPDAGWRQVVSKYYDKDADGYLSDSERAVTTMSVPGMVANVLGADGTVESIEGIGFFDSLTILRCGGIGLKTLDVSKLTKLTQLTCQGNELSTLTVKNNIYLEELNCSDNMLTQLPLTYNIHLSKLLCESNMITELNTNSLGDITYLKCADNQITALNLTNNIKLETLICSRNHLTSLDLSANTAISGTTSYSIGDQTTVANADMAGDNFHVALALPNADAVVGTTADSYTDGAFLTNSYALITNGIAYSYDTGNTNTEPMNVTIQCEKNFNIVNFYTSQDKTSLISTAYVNNGQSPAVPQLDAPQCRVFDVWSTDITAVKSDVDVYPVWKTVHTSQSITALSDDGMATITCSGCNEQYIEKFTDHMTLSGDNSRYVEIFDINGDGIINMLDYSLLYHSLKTQ